MKDCLKVLLVASEAAPFVKSGGLGDVAGSLPKALRAQGVDIRVVIPRYMTVKNEEMYGVEYLGEFPVHLLWRTQQAKILVKNGEVPVYFIENDFPAPDADALHRQRACAKLRHKQRQSIYRCRADAAIPRRRKSDVRMAVRPSELPGVRPRARGVRQRMDTPRNIRNRESEKRQGRAGHRPGMRCRGAAQ